MMDANCRDFTLLQTCRIFRQLLHISREPSTYCIRPQIMTATRTAIVTGASQGIGMATAIKLARDFTGLVLVSRNEKELHQTAEMISKSETPADTLILAVDLLQHDAADYIVSKALDKFGYIHAVVNIAGAVLQLDPFTMTDS
jgi:3-oxoacyl-[acyl-carrier protein] reductase